MNKNELASLREKILSDVMPLATGTDMSTGSFPLLIRIIQSGNATKDIYDKAYESAKSIDDNSEKLNALLALLDEVEYDVDEVLDDTESEDEAPSEQTHPIEEDQSFDQHQEHHEEHHDDQSNSN